MMDHEESSPAVNLQDDSGYHTNTPLSCEQGQNIMGRVPKDCNIDSSNIEHQSTPVAAVSKFKQNISPKMFDGILTQKIKPQNFSLSLMKSSFNRSQGYQSPPINDYRKRLHSMPNLLSIYETIKKKDVPSKRVFKRLLSIDFTADSIYRGWFNLDTKESGLQTEEKVDFIAKLCAERHLLDVALQILRNLEPQDLVSASKVTVFWKQIIKHDKTLATKLKRFNAMKKLQLRSDVASKENAPVIVAGSVRRRSSCADIKNLLASKRGSGGLVMPPPLAARFDEVARKNGRWLSPCPKCSHPAQVEMCGILAQCLRQGCGHSFCTKCRFKGHGDEKCKAVEQESPIKIIVGSKRSKSNLKRL